MSGVTTRVACPVRSATKHAGANTQTMVPIGASASSSHPSAGESSLPVLMGRRFLGGTVTLRNHADPPKTASRLPRSRPNPFATGRLSQFVSRLP